MTKSKTETEELKILQKESRELRKSKSKPQAPELENDEVEPETDSAELTTQVDQLIREVEEVATQHPALALLAAFGIGILVGQMLTRR
jgi:ElaB/YqjD/DUF883 family membrane-anchored ribosome-binding protein